MTRQYCLRTFGCQMNRHDAEKIANLLHHEGYRPTGQADDADLILVHTCSVRDKAEQKLYSELGGYAGLKAGRRDLVIGVGGCVAQQEGAGLLRRFAHVDFVFGPQNIVHLRELVRAARDAERRALVGYDDDPTARFDLPERHPDLTSPTPGRAFVTVMEGCDLFCSFCVVPRTRGREVSRPSREILTEVEGLAASGVVEVTLLGQTVNAYGRPRPGRAPGELPFPELLRAIARVPGIERIRFTSPHPIFTTKELIACYGELEELCPHLHLPLQSGSDAVLAAMNRRHTRDEYRAIVRDLRAARPDLALTTDLIVGFPGETRGDFEATLELVEEVGFTDSFSFKYSPRPGTPAVRRGLGADGAVAPAEAQARLEELQALQRVLTLRAHRARVGEQCTVLVEGPSRRSDRRETPQYSGRCPQHRVVNFSAPEPPRPGSLLSMRLVAATPHSLLGEPVASSGPARPVELPLA